MRIPLSTSGASCSSPDKIFAGNPGSTHNGRARPIASTSPPDKASFMPCTERKPPVTMSGMVATWFAAAA
jgi:hypothetical protein